MLYRLAAEAVLLLHFGFIVFVLFGALLALRWRWLAVAHLPAAAWGFFVEVSSRTCPLTHAENLFRAKAGQSGYTESFIEHYILPIVYPAGLTGEAQLVLAAVVVVLNVTIYGWLFYRRRKSGRTGA